MTASEYRAALLELGLSQRRAAKLFGADPRTSRRWALGEVRVPSLIAACLRLLIAGTITTTDLESLGQ